jgi:hypothetical protein
VQIHELKTGVEKPISANTARLTNVYQYPCDSAVKYIGIKISSAGPENNRHN